MPISQYFTIIGKYKNKRTYPAGTLKITEEYIILINKGEKVVLKKKWAIIAFEIKGRRFACLYSTLRADLQQRNKSNIIS